MIELGGNINLDGFETLEPSQLVVVKKIAGNYAKRIFTKAGDFEKLLISMKKVDNSRFKIQVKLSLRGNINSNEAEDNNLFFALDGALSKILGEFK